MVLQYVKTLVNQTYFEILDVFRNLKHGHDLCGENVVVSGMI